MKTTTTTTVSSESLSSFKVFLVLLRGNIGYVVVVVLIFIVFSLLERSTWSKTASSRPPFARLRLFSSQSRAISFGCCCCCGSHFHRFLSPREEHLVQNGIVSFRSSPSLFLVESRDFRLSLFCRFAFRVSQFHLAISQAFVSFRRFQPRKLFRFSSRFRIIIERPLDVFLERFLSQLGDASRAKLRLAPLVVDEPGEHGLRELREVLLEFQSVFAVHLLW